MVATPITKSTRYFRPGLSQVTYVPTIADYNAPTRTELDAGTGLHPETAGVGGWAVNSETIATPDLVSEFVPSIAGPRSAEDSSLTLYLSSDSVDVRDILPRGTTGFIVWFGEGDEDGKKMDVYPVTVTSAPKQYDLTDAAKIQVQFSVTQEPAENVTVPTAV